MKGLSPAPAHSRRRWLHCSLAACCLAVAQPLRAVATPAAAEPRPGPPRAPAKPAARAGATPAKLLVLGDSLSAEYGLARGTGWVALLEQRLARERPTARVVNASISGETSSGGRSRLPALLEQHRPTHLLIELGANDALRGLPLEMTAANLAAMARSGRKAAARVLLVGLQVPPNFGQRYAAQFAAMFGEVARREQAALVPFLLAGVADGADAARLFQDDRIHPNAQAQPRLLDNVWAVMGNWLR